MKYIPNNDKKVAFTLAETLITLVIIGVLAALTVPLLMNQFRVHQTVSQLTAAYSILSQAVKMAEIKNGKVDTWDIGAVADTADGSKKLYDYIAPEIKKLQDCGKKSGCFADYYRNMQGTAYPYQANTFSYFSRGRLNNGTSFLVWSAGSGCKFNYSKNNTGSLYNSCGTFHVDINGAKKPNRAGYDYFTFVITKDGLIPTGVPEQNLIQGGDCKHSSTKSANGIYCAAWVLYKKNMDYLYRDVSWNE